LAANKLNVIRKVLEEIITPQVAT